ncbi:hypothetical protein BV898_14195 [Hypsibius exemplaris]|uniref:Uncharacterized protein n=1 Tax=Hypsibius exemplaris TaxID=2072580 RepID=A0A1W0W8K4_HYPEX|nr:hypothetical protein BV898_14195 [Hypsibius exemplaris]
MESKKHPGKQFMTNVSFAPQQIIPTLKRLDNSGHMDNQPLIGRQSSNLRQDSLGVVSQSSLAGRRESFAVGGLGLISGKGHQSAFLDLTSPALVKCVFQARWKVLAYLQIVFGLLLIAVGTFSHYPVFTCGVQLVSEVDYLWFGLWIGILNLLCGACGLAASKAGLNNGGLHRVLRRSYFMLNCSFLPFANGIGLTNFGITLSKYSLICNPHPDERFTTILAFVQFWILCVCVILNVLGVVYQVVAGTKCKCWICTPKNPASA